MVAAPNKRLTIALLTEGLGVSGAYTSIVATGVVEAAERLDVNLLVVPGGYLNFAPQHAAFFQRKILYDLISPKKLDGVIIMGSLGNYASLEALADFHLHYRPLPTVSISTPVKDVPSIIADNKKGLHDAISHLIEAHQRQRIAFICGTDTSQEAQMRYQTYVQVLSEHGLPLDADLVAPGDFTDHGGMAAIKILLDERKVSFDAVVAANDIMALGAMKELQLRHFLVPDQVSIVGFDDDVSSQISTPSLTTVRQPMSAIGEQALVTLLEKIAGKDVPDLITLPTEAVIRQSCGCWDALGKQIADPVTDKHSKVARINADALFAALEQAAGNAETLPDDWRQQLLESFQAAMEGASERVFLRTLDHLLDQTAKNNNSLGHWQDVISVLSHFMRPALHDEKQRAKAENLWHQGRVSIHEITRKSLAGQYMHQLQQQLLFQTVSQRLITTINIEELFETIGRELPSLGIKRCYLALYDGPTAIDVLPERSRMMVAYDTVAPLPAVALGGMLFNTRDLAPDGFWPLERFTMIVEPLFFQDRQFGFACFDMSLDGLVYERLSGQMSSALQSATLVRRVEERAMQIQTAGEVSRAASSIMETDALVGQAVELICKRFNLYYVGLFLIDQTGAWTGEPDRWAVLRAGSGAQGQQLLERGHKLEVGGESMVSWCISNQQARIASDIAKDGFHFMNLLLTETRSEAALPLISRGKVIGALTIQSTQELAFTPENIIPLQTMADQLSNAIENASLFEQVQKRASELNKAREAAEKAREEAESAREEAEKARHETEAANRNLAAQMWLTTGQSLLNDRMRGEQDTRTLGNNVIQQLCKYIDARSGALYIVDTNDLQLAGTYACKQKNMIPKYEMGEDLVGQAAAGQEAILVEVPDEQVVAVSAAMGEMLPKYTLVAPFLYLGKAIGVVRLETFTAISPAQNDFLNQSLENMAIAFTTAQARTRVNELFSQTRRQAEELQSQEEELRATNEELQAQTDSLRASENRLKQNQTALEAANVDLEEKTHILQEKQGVLDRQNQVLRDAQQELERKAEELTQASKYKSEFLANMSHELRTPLNSMLILAGMLVKNEEGNLNADQIESAQVIHAGGTDLLNLINEILDLAKVEAGKMEFHFFPMEWETLINRMTSQFDPLAQRKGLAFVTSVADDLPSGIVTDDQRLAQILKNLVSNAFKFTETGTVTLAIHRPQAGSGYSADDFVAVSVTDTGIGMTPDQQKVVFEAFQQADGSTSRQYGGTGLGLAITREMAHRLGGQVVLQSELGKGSTFSIYLPLQRQTDEAMLPALRKTTPPVSRMPLSRKADAAPRVAAPKVASSIPDDRDVLQGSDRILLIVEDDPRFARVIFDYAHKKAFKCLVTGDGETALELLKRYKPHAMVLDLGLPGISGWAVLDAAKNNPDIRHIPIHIISANDEDISAFQRGAVSFLTKPVSQDEIEVTFGKIEQFITSRIKSLLLVEDDDTLRMSVRKLIEGSDVAITETSNGQAALEALAARQFDCMILDLSLPDMSGFELLNRLHNNEKLSKCPVIVYTGKALSEEENSELLRYAESVIVKGAKSPERLLDETALFLHRVIADLPEEKQRTIRKLHNQETTLEDKLILVVDDDTRNAFALSKLLADKGLKVQIAQNATKALELLKSLTDVNLILTDIMMPGMDGYEFMRVLRAQPQFKRMPIIALTAKAMKGDREKCLEAGASDYLSKPIDPDRLFSMLRVWLSRE